MNDVSNNASLTAEPNTWREVYPDTRNLGASGEAPALPSLVRALHEGSPNGDLV